MTVDALQLQRFDALETDVFVLTSAKPLSSTVIERLREQWTLGWPKTKLIVLDPGLSIQRIRVMPVIVAGDLGLDSVSAAFLQWPFVEVPT